MANELSTADPAIKLAPTDKLVLIRDGSPDPLVVHYDTLKQQIALELGIVTGEGLPLNAQLLGSNDDGVAHPLFVGDGLALQNINGKLTIVNTGSSGTVTPPVPPVTPDFSGGFLYADAGQVLTSDKGSYLVADTSDGLGQIAPFVGGYIAADNGKVLTSDGNRYLTAG